MKKKEFNQLKDELESVRGLWHHRPTISILEQENKQLKQQLSNLSENFDCLNNTVNDIMKREAIRDRGVQIPCPSTDEYDALMESEEPKQSRPSVEIVVATDLNGVIGVDGAIPWDCPEDRKLFKELTTGHVVVMGRKTYGSLPEQFKQSGLPDRTNIVMSRDEDYVDDMNDETGQFNHNIVFTDSQPEFIMKHWAEGANGKIFIIGGEEIYKLWMPFVDVIHHSRIEATVYPSLGSSVAKFDYDKDEFDLREVMPCGKFVYSKLVRKCF